MADKKVIAINIIHRTLSPGSPGDKSKGIRPQKPVIQVIKPNTAFLASTDVKDGETQSEYDFLTKSKPPAARDPKEEEKSRDVAPENLKPADLVGGDGGSAGSKPGELPEFDNMSKIELVKFAKENNIAIDANKPVADVRDAVKSATGQNLV